MSNNKQLSSSLEQLNAITSAIEDLQCNSLFLHQSKHLTTEDLAEINRALKTITKTLEKAKGGQFIIRQARLSDLDGLEGMVHYWAEQGENLPRSREDLTRNIQTFAVCILDGKVVGCACLFVYDSGLAEIRSLGVAPEIQGKGQGRALVEFLLKRAYKMEIEKVFVLTRNPHFFGRVGFEQTVIDALPEKILKDCEKCPKKDRCDEVAYEFNFDFTKSFHKSFPIKVEA